ncbi:uncharacterized protein lrrc66 isoform X2 [Denticeps clupeoides]|uniref:uncharacterized protein lrrc66 isoform X2 n=1 Tax=Denticeps clupeoides TaxID=299321 RepID=UPI0010A338A3|nr:leucine-rich repeat-containing protein 66 isoform X2 [Denticeps clupeoides]
MYSGQTVMYPFKVLICSATLICLHGKRFSPYASASPVPCLWETGSLLNCSALNLHEAPLRIPATIQALNLSYNSLRSLPPLWPGDGALVGLLYLWLGHNSLEDLSLCRRMRVRLKSAECGFTWAPALELLAAERNQLQQIPEGLRKSVNLLVLQLSYNKITALGSTDLQGCIHIRELHLHHNLISTIHPLAFRDVHDLEVLDLSFNLLTRIPPTVHLSLLNLMPRVDVSSNRWQCDFELWDLGKRLNETGTTLNLICHSPPQFAGKELLQLREEDFVCSKPKYGSIHHLDKTVDEGMEIWLLCSLQTQDDSPGLWWTPHGQASGAQQALLIRNITKKDAGLYICVSKPEKLVYIFELHVHQRGTERLRREIATENVQTEQHAMVRERERSLSRAYSDSDFILAVCLSVIITFIVAFILGVVLRPLLDALWYKIHLKRSPSSRTPSLGSQSMTNMDPPTYFNKGFSVSEDAELEARDGQRVTFAEVTHTNDDNYVTVLEDQEAIEENSGDEVTYENVKRSSTSTNHISIQVENVRPDEHRTVDKVMEFENIPDPEEPIREDDSSSSSSSSSSSDSEKEMLPISSQDAKPTQINGNKSEVENITGLSLVKHKVTTEKLQHTSLSSELKPVAIPIFSSEPFADWAAQIIEQNADNRNLSDADSGESFSFTDETTLTSSHDLSSTGVNLPVEMPKEPRSESGVQAESEICKIERNVKSDFSDLSRSSSSSDSEDATEHTETMKTETEISLKYDTSGSSEQDIYTSRPRLDTIILEPDDIQLTFIQDDATDQMTFQEVFSESKKKLNLPFNPIPFKRPGKLHPSNKAEEEPKKYNVHPVYRQRLVPVYTGNLTHSHLLTTSSSTDYEDPPLYNSAFSLADTVIDISDTSVTRGMSNKNSERVLHIPFDNTASSTDDVERTGSLKEETGWSDVFDLSGSCQTKGEGSLTFEQLPMTKRSLQFTASTVSRTQSEKLEQTDSSGQHQAPVIGDISGFMGKGEQFSLPKPKRYLVFTTKDDSTVDIKEMSEAKEPEESLSKSIISSSDSSSSSDSDSQEEKKTPKDPPLLLTSSSMELRVQTEEIQKVMPELERSDSSVSSQITVIGDISGFKGKSGQFSIPRPKQYLMFNTKEDSTLYEKEMSKVKETEESLSKSIISSSDSSSSSNSDAEAENGHLSQLSKLQPPKDPLLFTSSSKEIKIQTKEIQNVMPVRELERSDSSVSAEVTVIGDVSGFRGKRDQFSIPKPKRYLMFTTKEDSPLYKKEIPKEKNQEDNLVKSVVLPPDSSSSSESDSEERNVCLIQLPKSQPQKESLLLISPSNELRVQIEEKQNVMPELERSESSLSAQVPVVGDISRFMGKGDQFSIPKPKSYIMFTTKEDSTLYEKERTKENKSKGNWSKSDSSSSSDSDSEKRNVGLIPLPKTSSSNEPRAPTEPIQKVMPDLERSDSTISSQATVIGDISGYVGEGAKVSFPKPKRYLKFTTTTTTTTEPPTLYEKEMSKKNELDESPTKSVILPSDFSSSSDSDSENGLINLGQLPKPQKSLLFASSSNEKNEQLLQSEQIKNVIPELERSDSKLSTQAPVVGDISGFTGKGDQFSLPKPKRYLMFTTTEDSTLEKVISMKKEPEESITKLVISPPDSISSSDSEEGSPSKSQLPKLKKSLLFSSSSYERRLNTEKIQTVNAERERSDSRLSAQAPVVGDISGFMGKGDTFSLPKPKRFLQFTTKEDSTVYEKEMPVEKESKVSGTKPVIFPPDTSSSSDSDSEKGNVHLSKLPKPTKSLLFTSLANEPQIEQIRNVLPERSDSKFSLQASVIKDEFSSLVKEKEPEASRPKAVILPPDFTSSSDSDSEERNLPRHPKSLLLTSSSYESRMYSESEAKS